MDGFFGSLLAFLLAVFVVVVSHELGHYAAARMFRMPVLRFSFGFGKQLFSATDRNGTVWAFSLVPLGGYVKLLDLESVEHMGADKSEAFENQPLGKRAIVMFAGPFANFVLAFMLYLALTLQGETGLKPLIDKVYPGSPAEHAAFEAGERVVAVDGDPVFLWKHFARELLLGVTDASTMRVRVTSDGISEQERILDLGSVDPSVLDRNFVREVGLHPDTSFITRTVDFIAADSPAEKGGMQIGDGIIRIADSPVDNWDEVVEAIEGRPGAETAFLVHRGGSEVELTLAIASVEAEGEFVGKIGIRPAFDEERLEQLRTTVSYGFFDAVAQAMDWTVGGLVVTFRFIKFLFLGDVSTKNIAGPIRIANYASDSLLLGFISFLQFLAAISISLGVVNLLPIPVLDGGHLMLYAVEFARGKKLSARMATFVYSIGGSLVVAFMVFAIVNDLIRL